MPQTHSIQIDAGVLRAVHAGPVFAPGDEGWDQARQAWNLTADQQPALVAIPTCVDDVVAAVTFARHHGLRVAPQSTGHNATAIASLDDTVLVRMSEMQAVSIDPERRIARVEGGAEWQQVTGPAAEHGLAALAGSSPDVGVLGYTLGGGMSWLGRKYGLASRSVVAAEVVTAEGEVLRVDAERHPDLFWALKGGGGAFAVVTAIEFRLLPITDVYAGMLCWPADRAEEVVNAWIDWTKTTPDDVTTSCRVLNLPPIPEIPEPFRGRSLVVIDGCYDGPEDKGAEVLAPLRALGPEMDLWQTMPAADLQHIHMDPPEPSPGASTHTTLDDLTPHDMAEMIRVARSHPALLLVELRQLGGALSRRAPDEAAKSALDGAFAFFALGLVMSPEMGQAVDAGCQALREVLAPIDRGTHYGNFAEEPCEPERMWSARELLRLRAVKRAYDPEDRMVSNHPVD